MNNLIIRNESGTTFINQQGLTPATVSIHADHCMYEDTLNFNSNTPWDEIVDVCNSPFRKLFEKIVQAGGNTFTVRGDSSAVQVYMNEQLIDLPMTMVRYIADLITADCGVVPVLNFLARIQKNPNPEIYSELFAWVQNGDFVLTEDGCFIAYKKVRSDFKDIYTGSMDNSVGQSPTVPRHKIVRDREQTCAYGLHWCSWDYLNHYGSASGYRVVLVKVAPEDVDRIPTDYNRQKGVSWTYTVIGEVDYARDTSQDDAVLSKSVLYRDNSGFVPRGAKSQDPSFYDEDEEDDGWDHEDEDWDEDWD